MYVGVSVDNKAAHFAGLIIAETGHYNELSPLPGDSCLDGRSFYTQSALHCLSPGKRTMPEANLVEP